uniref:Retrovirus-related Pol polyprotein from transposon TNT 1-94 n=1 Tax=Tanacetum cinerariifolium TaxID=118510 RepID=A0A6L2NAL2_TANCI|nr:retrovirus-related Pol polyprotein from transposon TNT 1-94 [Tanacetum cinerariifolium]
MSSYSYVGVQSWGPYGQKREYRVRDEGREIYRVRGRRKLKRDDDLGKERYLDRGDSFHDLKPDGGNDDTRNQKGKRDDRGHDEGMERYQDRGDRSRGFKESALFSTIKKYYLRFKMENKRKKIIRSKKSGKRKKNIRYRTPSAKAVSTYGFMHVWARDRPSSTKYANNSFGNPVSESRVWKLNVRDQSVLKLKPLSSRQHGRMILESMENGPLLWSSIEENRVTRPKKYSELSATEAIQADCDVKATNIILQRLSLEGESLCEFDLRFSLLLNDMNIYNMKLEQFQVNTKFLNTLLPEWSKFMTDVKLFRDLHTTNVDQLHAYLGQHEFHANESQQYSHSQSSTPLSITYPPNDFQSSVHHNVYTHLSSIPQVKYAPSVNQQPDFSQPHAGLIVPVFQKEAQATQTVITHNAAYQADDFDAYDFDCDEINTAKIALMANLSHYCSDDLDGVHNQDNVNHNAAIQNANSPTQQDALILSVIEQLKTQVVNYTKINLDNKSVNDTLTAELERYKDQVRILKEGQNVDLKHKDNVSDSCTQSVQIDHFKQTLSEHLKEKESLTQTSHEKDMVTKKLKEMIKSLSRNMMEDKVKKKLEEIETINIELDHRVTKLIAENEHLKQTYKQLYDSIKSSRIRSKEQCDDLINQEKCLQILDIYMETYWSDLYYSRKYITTTATVPLRKPIALESNTPKPVVTLIYSRKPKASRNNAPVSKLKHNKSLSADKKEPNKSWGSIVFNVPSSSTDECKLSKLFSDNGTEFVNQTLREYYEQVGISYKTSVVRSSQQNDVVERQAVTTACYTQNRSIVRLHHDKTPYELLHDKIHDLSFFYVFGALCYQTNDSENLGKLQPKTDIGIFIGYAPKKKAFWIYNRCTRRIIKNIHVNFDELTAMASEQSSSGPALHDNSSTPLVPSSRTDWDLLFQPLFDELLTPPSSVDHPAPEVITLIAEVFGPEPAASTGSPSSTIVDQDAPSPMDTPMVEKSKLDEDKEGKAVDPSHYHDMIDTLLYLTASIPDLQYAICMCARYQARPTKKHLHAVKRIFQYLRGTVNRGLWYQKDYSISLTTFADANHAGCQDTRRITSGSLQFLRDRLISWSLKWQKSDAISSTEAEAVKAYRHQISLYQEHVENGVIELYFVNTKYQLADIFTKALGRERIEFLVKKLGMRSFTLDTLQQLTDEVDE